MIALTQTKPAKQQALQRGSPTPLSAPAPMSARDRLPMPPRTPVRQPHYGQPAPLVRRWLAPAAQRRGRARRAPPPPPRRVVPPAPVSRTQQATLPLQPAIQSD